jgi:uncharacterized protein YkwD/uncharacterized protein (DUF4415 family)
VKGGNPLRSLIRILIISILFITIGFYVNVNQKDDREVLLKNNSTKQTEKMIAGNQDSHPGRPSMERPKEGVSLLIGQDLQELLKEMGKPARIDATIYGYDWYIYNSKYSKYIQVGVENNRVVSIYAIGDKLDVAPFEIGQPLEEIFNTQYIDTNVDLNLEGNSFRFELNDTDINLRPLIQFGDIYAQAYFDKFTGNLSSVRFIDAKTLIKERPYELVYNGELIDPPNPNDFLWERAEEGAKKEIFDLTNVLRVRNQLTPLKWDEKTSQAAYSHSKDMAETKVFSHTSEKYGSLADRLKAASVEYESAGENIAANYTDGPAVVEGWLNSEGHRASLLNKYYTHLGVGVFEKYYTQDFIKK